MRGDPMVNKPMFVVAAAVLAAGSGSPTIFIAAWSPADREPVAPRPPPEAPTEPPIEHPVRSSSRAPAPKDRYPP